MAKKGVPHALQGDDSAALEEPGAIDYEGAEDKDPEDREALIGMAAEDNLKNDCWERWAARTYFDTVMFRRLHAVYYKKAEAVLLNYQFGEVLRGMLGSAESAACRKILGMLEEHFGDPTDTEAWLVDPETTERPAKLNSLVSGELEELNARINLFYCRRLLKALREIIPCAGPLKTK